MAAQMLTRDQMIEIIKKGESVTLNGRIIDSLESLPSEVEMSQIDPAQTQALLAGLLERRAKDDSIIAALQSVADAKSESNADSPKTAEVVVVGPDAQQNHKSKQEGSEAALKTEEKTGESQATQQPEATNLPVPTTSESKDALSPEVVVKEKGIKSAEKK